MKSQDIKIIAGTSIACSAIAGVVYISYKKLEEKKAVKLAEARQLELDKIKEETNFPPEYWEAKKAAAEADVEKHRIDSDSQERLAIDLREREDARLAAKQEFEKNAPDSYWAHKKFQEEEITKRQRIKADEERSRRIDERERETAKRQAQAIENGAKTIASTFADLNRQTTI